MVVGGLLFLAFVYFAFAQAAVARNGAQSAADAAALAAAQDVRDELTEGFEDSIGGEPDEWIEWILAEGNYPGLGYDAAGRRLAGENDADLLGGIELRFLNGDLAFEAHVKTHYTVGDSAIPGTENKKALAKATAVIEPRCTVAPSVGQLIEFDCVGSGHWKIDPKDFVAGDLPEAQDLFSVHLAE